MGTVNLDITVDAPPPVVWMALTVADYFSQWYTPDPDWVPQMQEFSSEVGGKRVVAFGPEGEPPYVEENELLEVVPHERLVFVTRMHQGDQQFGVTHCVLSLVAAVHGGTVLKLAETNVPDDEVEPRIGGWTGTFDNLKRLLGDDGVPQKWSGTFDAPPEQVWQAFVSPNAIASWFTPFPGAAIEVHECGYGVGERRVITFGKGEDWEHTVIETFRQIDDGASCTLSVDMVMHGVNYSQITGALAFTEVAPGKTRIDLEVTDGPTPERVMRCAGWGATLANLALVL